MTQSNKTTTPVAQAKATTEASAGATAKPVIEIKAATKAAVETGTASKAKLGSGLGSEGVSDAKADSGTKADAEVEADAKSEADAEVKVNADSVADAAVNADSVAGADSVADAAVNADSVAGAAVNADSVADAAVNADSVAGADSVADAEAEDLHAVGRIGKPVQMRDIARLAGVSKSTVSRALAGNPIINEKTRKLIMSLARKHNYRINRRARNFRLKDSLTIAVVLPGSPDADWRLTDPFFFELLRAVSVAIDEHGHQLLLTRIKPQQYEWIEEFINNGMADGLLLLGQGSMHRQISQIAKHYKAISVWGAQVDEHQNYPTVGTDNLLGGYRATRHLLEVGCRRILFLGPRIFPEPLQRYRGYLKAHKEAGIEVDRALCAHVHHDEESAYLCVGQLLAKKLKFDGIFAVSDLFAMSAIRALGEAGIRVPGDVCVVGYDDISLARVCYPSISSIRQNSIVGGKILVDNLLAVMEGSAPECVVMSPELVVRQSSTRSRSSGKAHNTHA